MNDEEERIEGKFEKVKKEGILGKQYEKWKKECRNLDNAIREWKKEET